MLQFSLTGGLGIDPSLASKLLLSRDGTAIKLGPQPVVVGDPLVSEGSCSADQRFIWKLTETGTGYWARRSAGEVCKGTSTVNPDVRVHEAGEELVLPPDANAQAGTARMVEVGPFRFAADLPWSRFSWWGKKLPADWQAIFGKAIKDPDGTQQQMFPGFAAFFDKAPDTFNNKYVGSGVTSVPKWNPIARSKHPDTGKDYGVFLAYTPRYTDRPINDPTNVGKLDLIWAPIFREWYERIWDWIESVASRIAGFVCDKITDPSMAATTAIAAQAGGPIAVGGYGAASLLCTPKTPDTPTAPTDAQPAIQKQPTWPYFLAGGLVLFGLLAFLLPPKRRAA